jgi:endonuclease-3
MVLWEQVAYLAADEKRAKAFEALRSRIGTSAITVTGAGKTSLLEIAALGGIFAELRAERMQKSAAMVIKDFGGGLDSVLALPPVKAKKALQRFPMIGEPGAEKILLFCGKLDVLALESNGLRVLTRLGFTQEAKSYSATYRAARQATLELLPVTAAHLQQAHLLLRRHGTDLCFRSGPACNSCPLNNSCPFAAHFRSK